MTRLLPPPSSTAAAVSDSRLDGVSSAEAKRNRDGGAGEHGRADANAAPHETVGGELGGEPAKADHEADDDNGLDQQLGEGQVGRTLDKEKGGYAGNATRRSAAPIRRMTATAIAAAAAVVPMPACNGRSQVWADRYRSSRGTG